MTFSAWKIKFLNPMTFQVSHDLYELYTCVIESDLPEIQALCNKGG